MPGEENNKQLRISLWVLLGYSFAVFGGLGGLIIGLALWRTEGGNDTSLEAYKKRHGKGIALLSVLFVILWSVAAIGWLKE